MREYEKKVYSQNGEDGILEHIFNTIGTTNKVAVEFGVSAGGGGIETNTRLLLEKGWKTYWLDIEDATNIPDNCVFSKTFLTADNICNVFENLNVPKEFDLLSIDVDGNDYHLREALGRYSPRVYIIEYNGSIPPDIPYVMPRNDNYMWKLWQTNFGASLLSYTEQATRLGYDLVYCDSRGVNAFYIKSNLNVFKKLSPEEAWVKLWWSK